MRITVSWDACIYGDRHEGHILGHPDKERGALLRDALCRHLRKCGKPFACIWVRDVGGKHGQHIHLALYWPRPLAELAWVLAGLTGSLPSSGRLPRGVVAQSECDGWQAKRNTAREEVASALRWTEYLLDQEPRHLVMPRIEGKALSVSQAIDVRAIAPHRAALEAWKAKVGLGTPGGALWRPPAPRGGAAMTVPAPSAPAAADLGIKLGGSARKGHTIALTREKALEAIFGTDDKDQASAFLSHCLKVLKPDEAGDAGEANDERHFLLSIVRDLAPRDAVERMLVVQMAATHVAVIRAGRWMATADNLPQSEAHTTGFNKLARTFAAQVEALQKHRRGGKQTVVVQHVNVADGGQAIVGHVETGTRDRGVGER